LEALEYLRGLHIAHLDVRSDNILMSKLGVLKLADFSSATITTVGSKQNLTQGQPPYWMAPEMRRGDPYDPHEADVWSVGATIWEVAEGDPPFIELEDSQDFLDRWPALSSADQLSPQFHDFLRLCSEPTGKRPRAMELLRTAFTKQACSHSRMVELLSQVREMEEGTKERHPHST